MILFQLREDSTNYKESSSGYSRPSIMHYMKILLKHQSIGIKFLKEVQKFFVKTCSYLLKSMPVLRDPTLKCSICVLKTY